MNQIDNVEHFLKNFEVLIILHKTFFKKIYILQKMILKTKVQKMKSI